MYNKHSPVCVYTREFGDLNGVGVALEAKTSQALPAVLVGKIEVPHQVLGGCFLHVKLICILLVKEAHFLHTEKTYMLADENSISGLHTGCSFSVFQ